MFKIPDKLKIAGYDYTVIKKSESFVSDTQACDGLHNILDNTITINTDRPEQYRDTTFLHEIIHAIIYAYCDNSGGNEEFVEHFAIGLYQFIKDNKEILFTKELTENEP